NDVSARDYQGVRGQHFLGKSCDTFAPLGPALVTADEIPDPQDLGLVTRVSGETMQSARTKDMHFPVVELIAFASRLMRLEPGDRAAGRERTALPRGGCGVDQRRAVEPAEPQLAVTGALVAVGAQRRDVDERALGEQIDRERIGGLRAGRAAHDRPQREADA